MSEETSSIRLSLDNWIRRGRDYLQVVIAATVEAADLIDALDIAWRSFSEAAGDDDWDMDAATAEIRPG